MTRTTAIFLLTITLAFTGCKKSSPKVAKSDPASAAAAEGGTPASAEQAAPPSAPDFSTPAVPAAPAATKGAAPGTPAPKAPAKPAIDLNASVMALCYHNIEDGGSKAMTIPVAQFEKEMQGIKDAGFTVIPMQDFLAWRRGEKNIPSKSCLITIDDGWISAYRVAWPILKKQNYPFTLFIYVNYIGSGGKSISWEQLGEMRDAGVDIQSHTYSHGNLKAPTVGVDKRTADLIRKDIAALGVDGWMRKEIVQSRKKIEEELGIRVNVFAYPYGNWNAKAREFVKEAGYEAAFTVYGQRLTHGSPYDLLGRYAIDVKQPKTFRDALAMIGGGVGPAQAAPSSVGQLAAASMVTQPLNNETITNPSPLIKANLATMGDIEPGSLKVRLGGVGELTPQFNPETKLMTAQVTTKLRPDSYTVLISAKVDGRPSETRWSFTVAPSAGAIMKGTPAPAPAAATPPPAPVGKPKKK